MMRIVSKSLIKAASIICWLYLITCISTAPFGIELRVEYGTLKISIGERFSQFLLYLLPIFIFIPLNNVIFLFGQTHLPKYSSVSKIQVHWLKDAKAAPRGAAFF